jgi:hypothetical protein
MKCTGKRHSLSPGRRTSPRRSVALATIRRGRSCQLVLTAGSKRNRACKSGVRIGTAGNLRPEEVEVLSVPAADGRTVGSHRDDIKLGGKTFGTEDHPVGLRSVINDNHNDGGAMAQKEPIHRIPLGRIRAAIWLNENGEGSAWYSVSITRSYNSGGEWKDSTSFGRDDLPVVRQLCEMAYSWIWERQATARSEDEAEL